MSCSPERSQATFSAIRSHNFRSSSASIFSRWASVRGCRDLSTKHVAEKFVEIELAVAVIGGFSAPLLFLTFAHLSYFSIVLYGMVFIIGTLVGLEIPLLMRILKDELDFKDLVSRVLASITSARSPRRCCSRSFSFHSSA